MILKVVTLIKDERGNYPVGRTTWTECNHISHSVLVKTNIGAYNAYEFVCENHGKTDTYQFDIAHPDVIHEIYIENNNGKTLEWFKTSEPVR